MIMLGDSAVGKSSVLNVYSGAPFNENHDPTVGIDFVTANHSLKDGTAVKMKIWDTAGQERFRTLIPSYIRDSSVAAIVFDVTSIHKFINLLIKRLKHLIQ